MNFSHKTRHLVKTTFVLISSAVLLLFYQSCANWLNNSSHAPGADSTSSTAPVAVVQFSQAEPILALHCASCHSPTSGNAQAIAAISDITSLSAITSAKCTAAVSGVNGACVNMGSPQTSPLYLDIIDQVMPANLPPNGTAAALTAGEIETIREWLLASNINSDVLSGSLPATGGASGGGGGTGTTPSYKSQIAPIISANCASCHGPNAPALTTESDISAEGAEIVAAITSTNAGLLMPPGAPLPSADIALIEAWVNAGAPNN